MVPLFAERVAEFDAALLALAAAQAPGRLAPLGKFARQKSSSTAAAPSASGVICTVYGLDEPSLAIAAQAVRGYLDKQVGRSKPIPTASPNATAFASVVERLQALCSMMDSVVVAPVGPPAAFTVEVSALGEMNLLRAEKVVVENITSIILEDLEVQPPEWWDPTIPCEKVRACCLDAMCSYALPYQCCALVCRVSLCVC